VPATDHSAVADGIIRLSQRTQAVFAQVADRHSLTPAQARLLCVLAAGPRGMTELAGILGIEKAALTGLADRAEQRGLLVRTPVAGDRRALSLALTPAGRRTAAAFHDDVSAELAALTCVLDPREREQFCQALARITGGRAL
jgi:DNA-binding MarR family transcriptional regulator